MTVVHLESLRFHVTSEDTTYLVDMEELNGNGRCTCRDFECRRAPLYKQNGMVRERYEDYATRCRHINAVVLMIGNMVIGQTLHGKAKA